MAYVELLSGTDDATSSIYVNLCGTMVRMPKTLPVVDMSAPVCCSPVAAGPLNDDAALEIALRLKALADPVRVKLVSLLFSSDAGEVCSCDLADGGRSERVNGEPPPVPVAPGRSGRVRTPRHERLSPAAPRRAGGAVHGAGPELLPLDRRPRYLWFRRRRRSDAPVNFANSLVVAHTGLNAIEPISVSIIANGMAVKTGPRPYSKCHEPA